MASEISINEVIVKLCSHFLELHVRPNTKFLKVLFIKPYLLHCMPLT